jgi:uncharacterized repeat protein (TIGR02543 family)
MEKSMKKLYKEFLVILIVAIMALSLLPATTAELTTTNTKTTTEDNSQVTAKAATVKVTWNANGGKIGTKNAVVTKVTKGKTIGKLPTTPKRVGYTFKGWYTKKIGGTKISKNIKPKKTVTFYAQWKKLSADEIAKSKLVGIWYKLLEPEKREYYSFRADGTFIFSGVNHIKQGNYKVSNGEIIFSNVYVSYHSGLKENYPNTIAGYELYTEKNDQGETKNFIKIAILDYPDKNNLPLSFAWRWIKR